MKIIAYYLRMFLTEIDLQPNYMCSMEITLESAEILHHFASGSFSPSAATLNSRKCDVSQQNECDITTRCPTICITQITTLPPLSMNHYTKIDVDL